jgi:hypothetical protein
MHTCLGSNFFVFPCVSVVQLWAFATVLLTTVSQYQETKTKCLVYMYILSPLQFFADFNQDCEFETLQWQLLLPSSSTLGRNRGSL